MSDKEILDFLLCVIDDCFNYENEVDSYEEAFMYFKGALKTAERYLFFCIENKQLDNNDSLVIL